MKKQVIIDFQGCTNSDNKFVLKEIAILHLDSKVNVEHITVKPQHVFASLPLKTQQEALWLYNHYHALTWHGGSVSEELAINILKKRAENNTVYVKGLDKRICLIQMLGTQNKDIDVHNVEDLIVPQFKTTSDFVWPNISILKKTFPLIPRCDYHQGTCALQNVYLIHQYLIYKI